MVVCSGAAGLGRSRSAPRWGAGRGRRQQKPRVVGNRAALFTCARCAAATTACWCSWASMNRGRLIRVSSVARRPDAALSTSRNAADACDNVTLQVHVAATRVHSRGQSGCDTALHCTRRTVGNECLCPRRQSSLSSQHTFGAPVVLHPLNNSQSFDRIHAAPTTRWRERGRFKGIAWCQRHTAPCRNSQRSPGKPALRANLPLPSCRPL